MFCANQTRITGGFGGRAKVLQTSVFPYGFYIKTCKGKTHGECVAYQIVEHFKAYFQKKFIKIV